MNRHDRLICAMVAGDYPGTAPTPGDLRARNAIDETNVGLLDVVYHDFAPGTVAANGRARWATPHGAPLFGWRWQRRAAARRAMQRCRRFDRNREPVSEPPF